MHEHYQIPAFALTLLLLPSLAYLAARFHDRRTLLWFFGFLLALVRMAQHYDGLILWNFSNEHLHPWLAAAGMVSIQVGAVLFVMSLAPAHVYIGRFRLPLAILFLLPVVIYAVIYDGVLRQQPPYGSYIFVLPALAVCSSAIALVWALKLDEKRPVPRAVIPLICGFMVVRAAFIYVQLGPGTLLTFSECAAHFMTALLLILLGRRFSPSVVLGALGFAAWSLSLTIHYPFIARHPELVLVINQCVVMGKVVAALGLILLALEDQLAMNRTAAERERRARREMEAYSTLAFSRRRVEELDHDAVLICEQVAENSRFAQVAMLWQQPSGAYRINGSVGLDRATIAALDALARRIPPDGFLAVGANPLAVEGAQTVQLDLGPLLSPGDELRRLHFTSALAVPMRGSSGAEGALLLAGMRRGEPLAADDLLPVELLTARLQAVRGMTNMQEQLIDAEKFAVVGQLAGSVSQQLHNPLTVILGYASLLADSKHLDQSERKGMDAILSGARTMRSTLESLQRVVRPPGAQLAAVSVTELLTDMERLYRPEFQRRSIEFRCDVAADLPRVMCQPQPLRQVVLHSLQFAIAAVEASTNNGRSVRLEATAEGSHVQILVAHSGASFEDPARAFDPFADMRPMLGQNGDAASLGLSLCASILKENNGRASAVNLDPHGAAILLELQAQKG
ncbi:sensor histidine kinase [Terracidiphilus gabretensis]|uniref:sensor histidine kinase n=1 Tax=Terracidiphilus gabretensis TaxID=1577687 RepID=UPI00071C0986|nr:histidine kinase dimerization/phospho-acceptor domain-containing protein [Terracidiphilus gabretensis]